MLIIQFLLHIYGNFIIIFPEHYSHFTALAVNFFLACSSPIYDHNAIYHQRLYHQYRLSLSQGFRKDLISEYLRVYDARNRVHDVD